MKLNLFQIPFHLSSRAEALPLSEITGLEWYEQYEKNYLEKDPKGQLVSAYQFEGNWNMWEMHPEGDEIVICLEGQIELIQLIEDKETSIVLKRGDFAINKKSVWHTANVNGKASAIFITTGFGTKNKERK